MIEQSASVPPEHTTVHQGLRLPAVHHREPTLAAARMGHPTSVIVEIPQIALPDFSAGPVRVLYTAIIGVHPRLHVSSPRSGNGHTGPGCPSRGRVSSRSGP